MADAELTLAQLIKSIEANPLETGGHLYHPIPFPEFAHLTTSTDRAAVQDKMDHILRTLRSCFPAGIDGLSILDIGANSGYYAFTFAQAGARVTAIEPHPRYAAIGRFLARHYSLPVEWIERPFSGRDLHGRRFDVGLALSVFQWMSRGGAALPEAAAQLRAVSRACRCLVFEMGFNIGTSALKTNKLNHYAALIRLLRSATDYDRFRFIARTHLWGKGSRFLILCSNQADWDDPVCRRAVRTLHF
jgi:SAM-dependent methyltransferase